MASTDTLLAFALATAVFAYFPGPALLYTAAQTLARGRRAGLLAALGIHVGGYAHVAAAALGLSAVFRHVPELYAAVKIVGALYLVWLGIGMLRGAPATAAAVPARSARSAFLQSIVVELLNPKVALFFIAFLPQFVDPAGALPVPVQFMILGIAVNCAFTSADLLTVAAASTVRDRFSAESAAMRWTRRVGGGLLVGLGLRLATDRT